VPQTLSDVGAAIRAAYEAQVGVITIESAMTAMIGTFAVRMAAEETWSKTATASHLAGSLILLTILQVVLEEYEQLGGAQPGKDALRREMRQLGDIVRARVTRACSGPYSVFFSLLKRTHSLAHAHFHTLTHEPPFQALSFAPSALAAGGALAEACLACVKVRNACSSSPAAYFTSPFPSSQTHFPVTTLTPGPS
jgi:hypothetical protein